MLQLYGNENFMSSNKKLIVILGPTACGKTRIATRLAAKYNGEIIGADSRQVYCGMDIGTGKDLADFKVGKKKIPHYLIDVVNPMTKFDVAKYQKMAYKAIDEVLERGKQPFLVGGTGLYLDSIIKGYVFGKKNKDVRTKLEKWSLDRLLKKLRQIDLATYRTIDQKNRRRVQRAVEIYYETGQPKSKTAKNKQPDYDTLVLGVKFPLEKIYQKIDSRLEARIKEGMIAEVKRLRKRGVTWKRLDDFGLEYRWVSRYLRGQIDYDELVKKLKNDIHHFAKRQLTWFKRNKDIRWVKTLTEADKKVKKFIRL